MKHSVLIVSLLVFSVSVFSQSLYVPSGTSGISTSSNSNVGIGTANPGGTLEVSGSSAPNFVLRNPYGRLEIGLAGFDGSYASYAKQGDVVYRLGGTQTKRAGLIFNIPINLGDGRSFFQFGDEKNSGWYTIYNNRTAVIDGKLGIGSPNTPTHTLDVSGDISANSLFLNGPLQLGKYEGDTGYGQKLYLAGTTENTDPIWIARYNVAYDASELRVNVGDYPGSQDRFVIGTTRFDNSQWIEYFAVDMEGNVGIGVSHPKEKLEVNGIIRAREIKIENANWPDYVFSKDYKLLPLKEVSQYIKEENHLPGIPSAEEVAKDGIGLSEMNAKLLQKMEEMTLYIIEQEKRIEALEKKVNAQQ